MEQFGTVCRKDGACSNSRIAPRIRRQKKSRCWKFTWNNPDENFVEQLRNSFEDCQYVFQLEKGQEGTVHVQGCIYYPNPRATWPCDYVHWARESNWRKSKKYCSKLHTRIRGPWTNVKNLSFRKTIKDPMDGLVKYNYQSEIIDLIQDEPDSRIIHWYWEGRGRVGKSSLAKHIRMNYKCILVNGCAKDCFCAIANRLESDDIDVVIFDIPRSQYSNISYKAIEGIKNGFFFSGKYESRDIIMNPPHVIVFCNFLPDMSMLSIDRWRIREIKLE